MQNKLMRVGAALAFFCAGTAHSELLDLADLPVTTVSTAPTNVLITFDNDEESMGLATSEPDTRWVLFSDIKPSLFIQILSTFNQQEFAENVIAELFSSRSAQFNKFAYDPTVTYTPPVNADGVSVGDADFNNALRGYYTDDPVAVDLGVNYKTVIGVGNSFEQNIAIIAENEIIAEDGDCSSDDSCSAYYYLHGGSGCNDLDKPDLFTCYERITLTNDESISTFNGRTPDEERANFANWYQFYATRIDATKTSLLLAFSPDNVNTNVRLGRQSADESSEIQSGPPSEDSVTTGISSFVKAGERENFYQWVKDLKVTDDTELRRSFKRVGEYIKSNNAYLEDPNNADSNLQTCRRNEHILITSKDTKLGPAPSGSFDNAGGSVDLPDGETHVGGAGTPYQSSGGKSLENLAFHYWANDAIGGAADNEVPTLLSPGLTFLDLGDDYFDPANDPAKWQHLRTSVVDVVPNASGANLEQVAINGRGQYVSPGDISALISGIANLVAVPDDNGAIGAVATSSGRTASNQFIFSAEFDTELKIGRLHAQEYSNGSEFVQGQEGSSCNEKIFGTICDDGGWEAERQNTEDSPVYTDRNIISLKPNNTVGAQGVDFDFNNLSDEQKAYLIDGNDAAFGSALVEYIKGDTTNEVGNGGADQFRKRSGPDVDSGDDITYLGPIVNSAPLFVSDGRDENNINIFNFGENADEPGYDAFVDATVADREDLVFVGANDGMLHAFDADTGKEIMGYVPNLVIENLSDYASPNYGHRAYVDGPLAYQDAYVEEPGNQGWRTVLIGGLRTGGQGYYALDISSLDESNVDAGDVVMWEFSDKSVTGGKDAKNLGYSFAPAQIVRTNLTSEPWVALIPSGYNSTEDDGYVGTGEASLFVVSLIDGDILEEIVIEDAGDDVDEPNGLSALAAITVDSDINVEFAYAGDLKGRMWKFDLRSSNISDWDVGLLFDAGDERPITAKPAIGRRPDGGDGQIVYFGTGQLLQGSDVSTSDQQAFYAVLDEACSTSASSPCVTEVEESELIEQSFSGGTQRTITSNSVNYISGDKGFIIELEDGNPAERVVAEPVLVGATVAFVSAIPQDFGCGTGVENYLYVVSRFSGGEPPNPPLLDAAGNSLVVSGAPVVGIKLDNDYPLQGVSLLASDNGDVSFNAPVGNPAGDLIATGRLRWRQLR